MYSLLRNLFRLFYYSIYGKNGKQIKINNELYTVSAHISRGVSSVIDEVPHKLLESLSKNANVVFDIGANVGVIAVLLSKSMKPGTTIYSFEPVPDTFKILKDNSRVQKGNAKILPYNLALTDHVGEVYFTNRTTHTINNILSKPDEDSIIVKATTVDEFCAVNNIRPNVLKVDVEGAEYHVLAGMIDVMTKNNCSIVMEIHQEMLASFGVTSDMFVRLLEPTNYNVYNVSGEEITTDLIMKNYCVVLSKDKIDKTLFKV